MAQENETNGTAAATYNANAATTAVGSSLVNSPFCREIRSKKYFFLQEMPTEASQLLDSTYHCWCQVTLRAIGPDGDLVTPQQCGSERSCYKSLFANQEES